MGWVRQDSYRTLLTDVSWKSTLLANWKRWVDNIKMEFGEIDCKNYR